MKSNIQSELSYQMVKEFYSAYLYLGMAAYFKSQGLLGFANWMEIQFQEEQFHAFKFYNYIIDRHGPPQFDNIESIPNYWESSVKVFEFALNHEKNVTKCINQLMTLAIKEEDYATQNFIKWFIDEQVEEEASFGEILQKLKIIGKDGSAIYLLDKELNSRVFTPPTSL